MAIPNINQNDILEALKYIDETSGSVFGGPYGYSAGTHDNRPPYYALCYIMKL